MLDAIVGRFGGVPAGAPPPPVTIVEPAQRGERRIEIRGHEQTAYIVIAYPAPSASDADYFAFQILDTILGGAKSMNLFGGNPTNRSSRLYHALVESEIATSVSSGMSATSDPFLYTISAVVRSDAEPDAVEAAIVREVRRIRDEGVSESEMERAKKQARAQFAYSAESVTNQGFWYGFAEVIADQEWLVHHLRDLDGVTADAVAAAASRWLGDAQRTVGRYIPETGARA
jgi:zinc protease